MSGTEEARVVIEVHFEVEVWIEVGTEVEVGIEVAAECLGSLEMDGLGEAAGLLLLVGVLRKLILSLGALETVLELGR